MHPLLVLALTLFVASIVSLPAHATDQDEALSLRREGKVKPLELLIGNVFQRHPDARILEVELEQENGTKIYEIEILTVTGEVREVEIDASTGELLVDELED